MSAPDASNAARRKIPNVTGISPKEGPPGTRVTIRGENLGCDIKDLTGLRICGQNCLLSAEWKSPNKIIARTGQAKGKGDIVVVTRSGGVGTCTVQFKGYVVQTGPLQDSAVWVDEEQTWMNLIKRNRGGTATIISGDHDDPLGISDESNDTKFPEDLSELFPDASGNTSEENFSPAWFLLENHHGTSFEDLKAGLAYLKRKSITRNEGPLAFVKTHLSTFMDCQDTLADMHHVLVADQKEASQGDITRSLEATLVEGNKSAIALFQDVLGRKDRADATRNALSVLHRFRFLFYLPCTIENNIRKGDYDLVITDYMRAKSLFGDTEVPIFKKVYEEVENRISSFRDMLYTKLLQLPSTLEEQKKLIRYLVHLETPGDPAWECLLHMEEWTSKLLDACKETHINKEREVEKERQEAAHDAGPPHLTHGTDQQFKSGSKAPPQKVQFVDDLTRILTDHLPDFWRLGQTYLTGKLVKEVKEKTRIDGGKVSKFRSMVLSLIQQFSNLIRAAFLPGTLSLPTKKRQELGMWSDMQHDAPIAWLPICVRYIRTAVIALQALDLPPDSMEILQQLAFDMRVDCMSTLLKQAVEDIRNLHSRETWHVDSDDERGGTTLLPALFENLVSETIQHLHEVIQPRNGENEVFTKAKVQKDASQLCAKLLQAFSGTLHQLALVGNVDRPTKSEEKPRPRSAIQPNAYSSASDSTSMPSLDKRLMVVMSNCQHTKEVILPRLIENLNKHGYPETDKVYQASFMTYDELDKKIFEHYIEEKANPVVGVVEQNMYAGRFDWNDCLQSTGVRRYIKEALMGMIRVHAEVYAINPRFVPRVMNCLVESVVDEITRLIQCVTGFNHNGALQARLELYAMELATTSYRTPATKEAFKDAIACLPELKTPDDKKLMEDLINEFQSHMKFQLLCFQPDSKTRQ